MANLGVVSCAFCLAASAYIACGRKAARHAAGWGMRLLHRLLGEATSIVGQTGLVSLLLRLPSWRALSEVISRRMRSNALIVSRESSCVAVLAGAIAVSFSACILARSMAGFGVGLCGSCVAISLWHTSRERARERALIDEMPEVFRTLAMALGSGETLTQAIEYVGVHERGYAGQAFVQAALRLRCGASTEEAMAQLSRDLDAPGVGLLTTALVIAQRTGSPLRSLFQSSARLVERQGEYERMLAVKTAQVRLSVRIVCLLPLLLVGLLSLVSVDYQSGLATLSGTLCVLVAAAMDACALLIIRHLMRGVV